MVNQRPYRILRIGVKLRETSGKHDSFRMGHIEIRTHLPDGLRILHHVGESGFSRFAEAFAGNELLGNDPPPQYRQPRLRDTRLPAKSDSPSI